jgi:hypothetical protein
MGSREWGNINKSRVYPRRSHAKAQRRRERKGKKIRKEFLISRLSLNKNES